MRRLFALPLLGALAILALPGSAFAQSDGQTCGYTANQTASSPDLNPGTGTLVVYADVDGQGGLSADSGTVAVAGACADGTAPAAGFDGGSAEAGAGEDSATGTADPGAVAVQPDGYVVIDGDNNNTDPQGQSDGYFGVSNYETGASRTSQASCEASGPDNGAVGSSNSGGCVGVDGVDWVYVPADAPTPMCGNSSGNHWPGTANTAPGASNNRDGCSIP